MVTRITIRPRCLSFEKNSQYKSQSIESARKEFADMADFLNRLAQFSSYVNQYPKESAEKAFRLHFPETDKLHRNDRTKKKRTFSTWFLTITEEDED